MDHPDSAHAVTSDTLAANLRKPTEMLVMVPKSQRLTLVGRKLFNAMLLSAQSSLSSAQRMPAADHMFEAPLSMMLKATGTTTEARTVAKKYLKEMQGLLIDWESTAPGDGVKWRGFAMLSQVELEVRGGQNWVRWSFPPAIMAALLEPQRWARLSLEVIAGLGTYASVALYEICARYRDNPSGVTSRQVPGWWIDALSNLPSGTEKRPWRKFKFDKVQPAILEINAASDIEIELIEHKQGREVQEVQFQVRKKHRQISLPMERQTVIEPADSTLVLHGQRLGVRESKVEDLILQFGEEIVAQQILEFEKRQQRAELGPINSPAAYLRSMCIAAKQQLGEEGEGASRSGRESPPKETDETTVPLDLRESRQLPEAPSAPPSEYDALRVEIEQLSEPERNALLNEAILDLRARGMFTKVVERRIGAGDIFFGPVKAAICQAFARQHVQPNSQSDGHTISA